MPCWVKMKNNVYDEKDMSRALKETHEKTIEKIGLPDWMKDLSCPYCQKKLNLSGIREVSLCFNARNFGDISMEFHCENCGVLDTLYFYKATENLEDFFDLMKNNKKPNSIPILKEKMYKLGYNNLLEIHFKGE